MLKKTIVYPDLDGNEVTEDFYFNLNTAELAEMEMSTKGGLDANLQKLIDAADGKQIIAIFKDIIASSVGRRSEDNRRFIKSPEITADFMHSEAYSILFMELIESEESGAAFIRGILPANVIAAVDASEQKTEVVELPENVALEQPAWIREKRDPTQAEFASMTREQMQEAFLLKNARRIDAATDQAIEAKPFENLPETI
jgi:hypothetical protein